MEAKEKNEFGLTQDDVEKIKDILPSLNLGQLEVGQSIQVEFTEQKPHMISFKDKKTGKQKEELVINCIDLFAGFEVTMWLSSKTLRMQLQNLYLKHGRSLKGLKATITVRPFEHKEFGEVRAYNVQEIKNPETIKTYKPL